MQLAPTVLDTSNTLCSPRRHALNLSNDAHANIPVGEVIGIRATRIMRLQLPTRLFQPERCHTVEKCVSLRPTQRARASNMGDVLLQEIIRANGLPGSIKKTPLHSPLKGQVKAQGVVRRNKGAGNPLLRATSP